VWACAILSNHAHLIVRRHRDDALEIWHAFAGAVRTVLRSFPNVGAEHPALAARPYKVFLRRPGEVRGRIGYVERNPEKDGLPRQKFDFVQPYDNWPFHKATTR